MSRANLQFTITRRNIVMQLKNTALVATIVAAVIASHFRTVSASRDGNIKVHGHWVIEVTDRDGAVIARREFENSITEVGKGLLAGLLARNLTLAHLRIRLDGTSATDSPCSGGTTIDESGRGSSQTAGPCWIVVVSGPSNREGLSGTAVFSTLTRGASDTQVILTGQLTALADGQIASVSTQAASCPGNFAPSDCEERLGRTDPFTSHTLVDAQGNAAPVLVAKGRIVQVSVTISFS